MCTNRTDSREAKEAHFSPRFPFLGVDRRQIPVKVDGSIWER